MGSPHGGSSAAVTRFEQMPPTAMAPCVHFPDPVSFGWLLGLSLSLSAARHGFSSDGRWGLPCQRRRAGRPHWEPRRGQPRHAGLPLRPPIAIRRRGAVVPALLPVRPLLLSNPCFLSLLFSPSIFYPGEVTLSSFRLQAWRTPAACWALPTCRQRTGLGGG